MTLTLSNHMACRFLVTFNYGLFKKKNPHHACHLSVDVQLATAVLHRPQHCFHHPPHVCHLSVVVFMMMLILMAIQVMVLAHGRTEGALSDRAMPLGVDRTAVIYLCLFIIVIVLCST